MELSKIVSGVILLLVGVILVSALVIPTIGDVQKVTGDPVTYANSGANVGMSEDTAFYQISDDTKLTYTVSSAGVSIGDVAIPYSSTATWGPVVWTDVGTIEVRIQSYLCHSIDYDLENNTYTTVSFTLPVTIEVDGKTATVTDSSSTPVVKEISFNEGYCLDLRANEDSEKLFMAVDLTQRFGTFYLNSVNQITCMGIYSTGENDCYFKLSNGVVTNNGGFTGAPVTTLTLVDGTTDVYELESFKLDIGGEEFTPYYSIIPLEINGHKESGTAYTLFGLIPLLLIVSLVLVPVGLIAMRSYFGRSD